MFCKFQGIDAGTYKSLINVTNNDPGARGNVEMTNLPPLVTDDDDSKQAPLPAIPKSGSTQEILNLTLHQVCTVHVLYKEFNENL